MSEPTHHEHVVVSPKVYAVIFALLLIFTATTVGASYLELGVFNAVVALAIAVTRESLVTSASGAVRTISPSRRTATSVQISKTSSRWCEM